MKIIPAIDVIDGKCVRLSQGDYQQKKVYDHNPLQVAKSFKEAGLQYLHLVDLDGAKNGKVTNWKVIEDISRHSGLIVDFGGGIKTESELKRLFDSGINQVNLGSIAVKNSRLVTEWIEKFGAEKIILSADVKNEKIAISGWMEDATIPIDTFLQDYLTQGIRYVTCTDISKDGMLGGPNLELYKRLLLRFPEIKLIASGGVGTMDDVIALQGSGVEGIIIGKAIYEGRISLEELSKLI